MDGFVGEEWAEGDTIYDIHTKLSVIISEWDAK